VRTGAAWLPPVAWAGVLFLLSSLTSVPGPDLPHVDKLGHFLAYAVLGLLLARAADASGWSLGVAVLLGIGYGISDELHQAFVPLREPSWADLAADAAGVVVAVLLYARWRERRSARRPPPGADPRVLRA
jgi:VanZ family protein